MGYRAVYLPVAPHPLQKDYNQDEWEPFWTAAERAKFEGEGRQGSVRLRMPREGACRFQDHIRGDLTVDDYCVAKVTEDISETSRTRVQQAVEGFLLNSYFDLAVGEDDSGTGYGLLAEKIWARYQNEISRVKQSQRIALPGYGEMKKEALDLFDQNYDPTLVARLHTKLGLPAPTNAPPAAPTNAPTSRPPPGSQPNP